MMRDVSDPFLLAMSEVFATLIGFLLVAMFFFIERKSDREFVAVREKGFPYLRAAVRMTLILYALALVLVVGLVALDPIWSAVLFAAMSLMTVISAIDVTRQHHELARVARVRGTSPVAMWVALAAVLLPPWVVGGLQPGRTVLTIAALLAGAFAFVNTIGFLLSTFDVEHLTSAATGSPLDDRDADQLVGGRASSR